MGKEFLNRIMFGADDPGAGGALPPQSELHDPETQPSKLTNKEVNDLIKAKEGAAVAKLLKEAGVESTGKLKEDLAALKTWQDSQKSEVQRIQDEAKANGEKLTAAEARAIAAETKVEAMAQGVDPAKVDRAAKLIPAYDGETAAEKVKAFLAENPEFAVKGGPVMPTTGVVKAGAGSTTEALKASVGKAFGLKGSL